MKVAKRIFILIVIITLLISGCAYRDMNRLQFVTLGCIDINDQENIIIYAEVFIAKRTSQQSGEEVKYINKGEGDTIFKGYELSQTRVGLPAAYDITKAVIFTDEAAQQGLDLILDGYERNQKPSLKQYMFICKQAPEEILTVELPDELFLGFYLESFMVYNGNQSHVISIRMNEFFNNRDMGSQVNLIPVIKKMEQVGYEKIEIDGAAVIKDDKMVSTIEKDEVDSYKIFMNTLMTGTIVIENPMNKNKNISIQILKCSTKKKITYAEEGETLVDVDTEIVVSIPEVQGKIKLTDEKVRKEMEKETAEALKKDCLKLFYDYQHQGIDLLNIQREVDMNYPHADFSIEDTQMNMDVKVNIDGSGISTNSE